MPSRALGALTDVLLPVYCGTRFPLALVIRAYFDDAKAGRDAEDKPGDVAGGIVAVGGYLCPAESWDDSFAPSWARLLADPSWPTSPIREFKASDCRGGAGEFRREFGWSDPERHRLMVRAVEVITTSTPSNDTIGLGAAIELPPIQGAESQFEYERFAFFMCFEQVIQNALNITKLALTAGDDTVQFIFDEQPGYQGVAVQQFEQARAAVQVGLRHRVPPPQFASSLTALPLQAADLLAHETYKEVKGRKEGRPFSGALRALIAGRQHYGDIVDARAFAAIEKATREGLSGIPAEELRGVGKLYESNRPIRS